VGARLLHPIRALLRGLRHAATHPQGFGALVSFRHLGAFRTRADATGARPDMVTIADVARHAGVSTSTVSYVLSGKRTISDDTRERVRQAVDALEYRPNASARALASRRVNALALVAPFRADNNVPVLLEFV